MKLFTRHGIFTEAELHSRYEILMENYAKKLRIEALTMTDMARRQILPAVTAYTRELTASALEKKRLSPDIACDYEEGTAKKLSACAGTLYHAVEQLQEDLAGAETRGDAAEQALFYKDTVLTDMSAVRAAADEAESLTAGEAWPFPTYADLLYGV